MRAPARLRAAALAGVLATPGAALAQQGATSAAAAEKLFQEGRALIAEGRYADACPKLAESLRLDPAVGTSLNLAECYERTDKIASAWVTYRKAETMARRAGQQERMTHSASRAEALERSLSYMTITVASHPKGFAITRDGERIGEAAWGTAVPIDGGMHHIEASAPGRRTWKRDVPIASRSTRLTVAIPELEHEPSDVTQGPDTTAEEPFPIQRTLGWVSIAAGVAALGTGVAFGLIAKSKNDEASTNHCSAIDCDQRGVNLTQDASSAALVSTVLFAAGGVLSAGGVVLVLTAPKRTSNARVGLSLSPAAYGLWATF